MERRMPTKEEVLSYLKDDRNWGRWGDDDQIGAVNMITPEKRIEARRAGQDGAGHIAEPRVPLDSCAQQPDPGHPLHEKGLSQPHCRVLRRLLRDFIPWHGDHPPRRPVPRLGRERHVERPQPGHGDHHGRRPVGRGASLERGPDYPRGAAWTCPNTGAAPT